LAHAHRAPRAIAGRARRCMPRMRTATVHADDAQGLHTRLKDHGTVLA